MSYLATLQSPLTDAQLLKLEGKESMSKLFHFTLQVEYTGAMPQADAVIGQPITATVSANDGSTRYFSGMVSQFSFAKQQDRMVYYLQMVPRLWLLQHRKQSRIFQQQSLTAIIEQVFSSYQIVYQTKLTNTYPTLEYCVQYEESDWTFVQRLLEQAGIFYYFQFGQQTHTLILADNAQAYTTGLSELGSAGILPATAQLYTWQVGYSFYPGQWQGNDQDMTNPTRSLLVSQQTDSAVAGNQSYGIYEYPGKYLTTADGSQIAQIRVQEQSVAGCIGKGTSNYLQLTASNTISFNSEEYLAEQGKSYVVIDVEHHLDLTETTPDSYSNEFTAIPATQTFRPARVTPKPTAPTIQLGTIVGQNGQDINTDQYGQMQVQFNWDINEDSSCYMRAVQPWEGALRIGTPVAVGFIDGDIDQPLILGPIYNANLMPLYTQPSEQNKSSLKRRHPNQNTQQQYNEICFDDTPDNQQLLVTATKDMIATIQNDYTQQVVQGNYVLQVKGNITIQCDGSLTLNAQQDVNIQAGSNLNLQAGSNLQLNAQVNLQAEAGSGISQKAPQIQQQADANLSQQAALMSIESDGILTLKGSLIQEN